MRISNRPGVLGKIAGLLLAAIAMGSPRIASADIVQNDDVIITGSLGVGFDSANGQTFNFDTIILKENNLRVLFDDTSVGAFPANDWRITANDIASGGASFFSIDDATTGRQVLRVDAGAPANSLRVDSSGKVGIGTATPVLNLHVFTGNSPAMRLEQDGSGGFTPYTWDIAGNETNFFVRDVNSGSTLPFRIFAGAATSSLAIKPSEVAMNDTGANQDVRIKGDTNAKLFFTDASTNRIGMGTDVPAQALHLKRTTAGAVEMLIESADVTTRHARLSLKNQAREFKLINNGNRLQWFDATSNFEAFTIRGATGRAGFRNNNPAHPLSVGLPGDATIGNGAHVTAAGVWTNGSTRKSKERIVDLDDEVALDAFDKLNPVTYYGKNQDDEQYVGFIAEDVPELVAMKGREGIAAIEIAALVTKVVQQQRATIEAQKETIASLEKRVEKLEASKTAE